MQQFATNVACRYLVYTLMVSQANWFCHTLALHQGHDFTLNDVQPGSSAGPLDTNDLCGSIVTEGWYFGFDAGHISSCVRRGHQAQNDAEMKRQNIEWSKHRSLIDSNGAIQLATNWLALSGAKVSELQSNYTMSVTQRFFYPMYQPTNGVRPMKNDAILLPIFQVEWRGQYTRKGRVYHRGPVAKVIVSGMTKELWECDMFSERLVSAPLIGIKDLSAVLSVKDSDFLKYDGVALSNFVAKYGAFGAK